jgi:hypothetical protein
MGKVPERLTTADLTALLIEATKQKQAEMAQQRAEITSAPRQMKTEQAQILRQAASISSRKAQVRAQNEDRWLTVARRLL